MIIQALLFYFKLLFQFMPFYQSALVNAPNTFQHQTIIDRLMNDPTYLSHILSPNTRASKVKDINAYQHLPEVLIRLARKGDVDTFRVIIDRSDLVDWRIENRDRFHLPLNYRLHLMHLGDIDEISRVLFNANSLESDPSKVTGFNSFNPQILEIFVDLILKNMHKIYDLRDSSNSRWNIISQHVLSYLSYYGREKDFKAVYDHFSKVGIDTDLAVSALFAVQNQHLQILSFLLSRNLFHGRILDLSFRFACILGDLNLLVKIIKLSSIMEKERDFNLELDFVVFHKHHAILHYFSTKWKYKFDSKVLKAAKTQISKSDAFSLSLYLNERSSVSLMYRSASIFIDVPVLHFIFKHFDMNSNLYYYALDNFVSFNRWDLIEPFLAKENIPKILQDTTIPEFISKIVSRASILGYTDILDHLKKRNLLKSKGLITEGVIESIRGARLEAFEFYLQHFMKEIDFTRAFRELFLGQVNPISTRIVTALLENDKALPFVKKVDLTPLLLDLAQKDFKSFQTVAYNHVIQREILGPDTVKALLNDGLERRDTWLCTFLASEVEIYKKLPDMDRENYSENILKILDDAKNSLNTISSKIHDELAIVKNLLEPLETVDSKDVSSNQLIPFLLLKLVQDDNEKLLKMVLDRDNLVNWAIEGEKNEGKPMDYHKYIIHAGDILDICHFILKPPPLGMTEYGRNIIPSIHIIFVKFLLYNMQNFEKDVGHSRFDSIATFVLQYLSHESVYVNLNAFLKNAKTLKLYLSFGLSGYYLIQKNYINTLEEYFKGPYIDQSYFNSLFQYACVIGNKDALDVLIRQQTFIKKKKAFEYELASLEFNKHVEILEYFLLPKNKIIKDKIGKERIKSALKNSRKSSISSSLLANVEARGEEWIVLCAQSFDDEFVKFILKEKDPSPLIRLIAPIYSFNENIAMIMYLADEYKEILQNHIGSVVLEAAAKGHGSILSLVRDKGFVLEDKVIQDGVSVALSHGQTFSVQFFLSFYSSIVNPLEVFREYFMTFEHPISSLMTSTILDQVKDPQELLKLNEHSLFRERMRTLDTKSIQFLIHHDVLKVFVTPSTVREWIIEGIRDQSQDKLQYLFSESSLLNQIPHEELEKIKNKMEQKMEKVQKFKTLVPILSDSLKRLHSHSGHHAIS